MAPPLFSDAARAVEASLSSVYGAPVEIGVLDGLDERLVGEISGVEERMFRGELRYSAEELRGRGRRPGFFALTVRKSGELAAFFFGYEDPDLPRGFYGDTLASLVEGRGVGGGLFALVHLLCYWRGYSHFSCHTEEVDEKGRRLREWYLAAGMDFLGTHPSEGDRMRVRLTAEHAEWIYRRFILGERDLKRAG